MNFCTSSVMRCYLYLGWFYNTKKIRTELNLLIERGYPSKYIKDEFLKKQTEIEFYEKKLKDQGFFTLTPLDDDYPKELMRSEKKPFVLTGFGDLNLINSKQKISIVGSRKINEEVEFWLDQNIQLLAKEKVIVSGGARGVDQCAHRTAFRNGLGTVFILPSGLLNPYPSNLKFYMNQEKQVLFLSQFHPKQRVAKHLFYPRNYLLASLSERLVVAQAELKSGSMVTAKYAIDLNKEIYVVPASPWEGRFSGNVKLLEEGAYPINDFTFI